jgi:hypothetical protein
MNINLRVVGIAALLVLTMLLGIRFRQQRTAIMLQNYRELSAVATRVAGFLQGNDFGSLIQMIEPSAASDSHREQVAASLAGVCRCHRRATRLGIGAVECHRAHCNRAGSLSGRDTRGHDGTQASV